MSSATEQKKLRELARKRLNLGPRASVKQIIKALDSPMITVANFYKQMRRFQKADEAYLERKAIQEEAQKRMERITQSIQKEKEKKEQLKEKRKAKPKEPYIKKGVIVDISGPCGGGDVFQAFQEKVTPKLEGIKGLVYCQLTRITYNGKRDVTIGEMINFTEKNANSAFWKHIFTLIKEEGSSDPDATKLSGMVKIMDEDIQLYEKYRFVLYKAAQIPSVKIQQAFLDGPVHCVIDPLYQLWFKMGENSESPASKKRCFQIANKIKALEDVYPEGVPENNMEEVAKVANRCIIIHDIIGNEIMKFNPKSSKFFHFTNTRKNHIDQGFLTMDKQFEPVDEDQLKEIIKKADWALIGGDMENPQSARTIEGAYSVYNQNYELFQDFSKSIGIQHFGINAVKHKDLNEFLKESRIINSAPVPLCDSPNNSQDVKHADLVAAYTQHSKCSFYQGFLGMIHQYVKINASTDFIKNHVGIYQFKVLKNDNPLLLKLGIQANQKYTLPSPEILYMISRGVVIETIAGCWGSTFHFEYSDEMLENRNYCIWAGKQGSDHDCDTYSFKGDAEWASHLKAELGNENVFYFSLKKMIVIKIKRKSYTTKHHLLSFITSYTRLNMLELMEKIDGELVKVILDGIYYRGEIKDATIEYKHKEIKRHVGFADAWYFPSEISVSSWAKFDERFDGNCVLAGPGGTGKTFSVYDYKGFTDVLYVVPCHTLGKGKHYTTIHRLIGEGGCRSYRDTIGIPKVILIDELTQVPAAWIEQAIKMYPHSMFLIAGDIDKKQWFQCRTGHIGNFNQVWIPKNWRYVFYENDYRSLDDDLKQLKGDIRNEMKRVFTGDDISDFKKMNDFIKKRVPTVSFEEAVTMTNKDDLWIAGTHRTQDSLKEKGIMCEFNGEIKPSFTVHEFQGLTVENKRVFIKLDMFEYAMIYTAVSRVRKMGQLVFVR
jgi:hypothetical protein